MSPQERIVVDAAMMALWEVAKAEGLHSVTAYVRADGRVHIYGEAHSMTKWRVDGDLQEGGALCTPGEEMVKRAAQHKSAARGDDNEGKGNG